MLLKEGLPRLKQYTENLHEDKQGIVPTQTKLGKLCKYKNQTRYRYRINETKGQCFDRNII